MELIENVHDFSLIADEWNELADRFKTPLLKHEWFGACARRRLRKGKNRQNLSSRLNGR